MSEILFPPADHKLPAPLNSDRAAVWLADWRSQPTLSEHPLAGQLAHNGPFEALLSCIAEYSPFLSRLALRDPGFVIRLAMEGPDYLHSQLLAELSQELSAPCSRENLMATLRICRNRMAFLVAAADLAGVWSLQQVTSALSDLAETCLSLAVAHLLRERMASGDLAWTDEETALLSEKFGSNSGYFVLGMGKLGSRELNYSSDIDLIVLFDPQVVQYTGRRDALDCFVRMTRDLVQIMQSMTPEGFVFRTDLRLRPDPGATTIAMSCDAAEVYYQSVGLNWERAAMIKARPVAGDRAAAEGFLQRIRGFVWRKHLDYAAVEDIHKMKQLIHSHHHHDQKFSAPGFDVKLGPGGIREIEFFVQMQQLIAGGRAPDLRTPRTLDGLQQLVKLDMLDASAEGQLHDAYTFLRTVEHRLQMVSDEQTQKLPEKEEALARIALFCGFPSVAAFSDTLEKHLLNVRQYYQALFEDTQQPQEADSASMPVLDGLYSGEELPAAILDTLQDMGFRDADKAAQIVRGWMLGRYRACRTERARGILRRISPLMLQAFAKASEPDAALLRFDEFLSQLPAGVQLFSLLQAHDWLFELLGDVLSAAPALGAFLSKYPNLLDAVIGPEFLEHVPSQTELAQMLAQSMLDSRDFQDRLDVARRFANERKFQIGVQVLQGTLTPRDAGVANTRLADVLLSQALQDVSDELAVRHGYVPGAGIALIGMGSLGGGEITFTSDLDIVLVYDAPADVTQSDGEKPLSVSQYFIRLGQRLINAMTAPTGEGTLYEVDMRLRPSGNAGPLAVSLDAFLRYQAQDAWIWEHMALTRARVVYAPEALSTRLTAGIAEVLNQRRDPIELRQKVVEMRQKLAAEFSSSNIWDVKHARGGLLDVEFIAQYLCLLHGADHPAIFHPATLTALQNLQSAGILTAGQGKTLSDAWLFLNTLRSTLRLCIGDTFDPQKGVAAGLDQALLRVTGSASMEALEQRLLKTEADIRKAYSLILE